MSVFNNNSADTNFGFDFYLFGDGQPPTFVNPYIFDSVATANGQDGSHADNLDPPTEGYVDQFGYQDCTILNMSGSQVVNPYTSHTESPHENSGTGEPMLATALDNDLNKDELSTIRSPVHSDVPIPIPSYTTKILSYGPSEQPLVGQFSDSRRSDAYLTTSAEKGKIQTMDCVPPLHSVVLLLNHQQPPTADTRGGSSLQTVPNAPPNTDLPTSIAPSSGPQRHRRGKETRAKATQWNEPKCKGEPTGTSLENVSSTWGETKDRFVWKMLEVYYFRSAVGPINAERAFAQARKAMEDDLHRSPLAAQAAKAKVGGKLSRVHERYLTHILTELRRSKTGEIRNETHMYVQVLAELRSELVPINKRHVLRDGHSDTKDPSKLKNEMKQVKHRVAEQERRTAIRHLQDQISAFFLVRGQKKISVGDLLLFVIIYLRIGDIAFPGLIQLRSPRSRWQNSIAA